ncbi:DNA cytosine methyltransferase [Planktomarina sp.]|nr:DNA cytosine methyltransferase [Planktomarina sp.]
MNNIVTKPIQVVDLFSGPGGLGEGFSSCKRPDGSRAYQIAVSIEKDAAAHKTLRLRSFLRQFNAFPAEYYEWIAGNIKCPDWENLYPLEWNAAATEAICAELGNSETSAILSKRITKLKKNPCDRTLLIGGPPCQAYSLAGRSRNAGNKTYIPKDDSRHFLYREYCRVLNELSPDVFVMENVKGMLSSSVEGLAIFEQVMSDLERAGQGYQLLSLSEKSSLYDRPAPKDFIIRSENYGVPQARHRVFIVGVRSDLNISAITPLPHQKATVSVKDALSGLPKLRSGLSKQDSKQDWYEAMIAAVQAIRVTNQNYHGKKINSFIELLKEVERCLHTPTVAERSKTIRGPLSPILQPELRDFLDDPDLIGVSGNEARGHMPSDLARYLFAACFAAAEGVSPRSHQYPESLAPNHKNWNSGKFIDRFRVQVENSPASTITSHISKDGHYFIHPDPIQCRSLTVREAARLQTFPDNYHFMGNRTEQFVQVGNAVPPFLAQQIANLLLTIF